MGQKRNAKAVHAFGSERLCKGKLSTSLYFRVAFALIYFYFPLTTAHRRRKHDILCSRSVFSVISNRLCTVFSIFLFAICCLQQKAKIRSVSSSTCFYSAPSQKTSSEKKNAHTHTHKQQRMNSSSSGNKNKLQFWNKCVCWQRKIAILEYRLILNWKILVCAKYSNCKAFFLLLGRVSVKELFALRPLKCAEKIYFTGNANGLCLMRWSDGSQQLREVIDSRDFSCEFNSFASN